MQMSPPPAWLVDVTVDFIAWHLILGPVILVILAATIARWTRAVLEIVHPPIREIRKCTIWPPSLLRPPSRSGRQG